MGIATLARMLGHLAEACKPFAATSGARLTVGNRGFMARPRASAAVDADAATVEKLLAEGKTVVIDFYATWCGPCKSYSPKFARLEREVRRTHPDASVAFVSVDIDLHQDIAREARVMSVPTTVGWRAGKGIFGGTKKKEVLRFSGDKPWMELLRAVDGALR